jgi:phage repressor protein C with HTH and peptisase S24 domain
MSISAADRLKSARAKAGYASASAFAAAHGLTESGYRHKENKTREISVSDAKLYARLLSKKLPWITWNYIIGGEAPKTADQAKVIGYVGAGEQIFAFDDEHAWDPVPAPPGAKEFNAAVVKGDSMLPVFRDGDLLYFSSEEVVISEIVGRDCLVQVVDGPRLIKKLVKGSKRGFYRLHSYASGKLSDEVKLEWAAPVRWIERR